MRATYSPEDNKLRLYAGGRLPRAEYEAVRAAGFISAPKQECFVAPMWTPAREDFALTLADEIDDEDYSPAERSADRAERFEEYREKRTDEAEAHADTFDAGPAAFGHQNQRRAERQATRHDRTRTRAVSQWSKAVYWEARTAGVIASALYKSSAPVRRSRIKRLEADERKNAKEQAEYAERFAAWSKVPGLDGATQAGRYVEADTEGGGRSYGFDPATVTPALQLAYRLANFGGGYGEYEHPRTARRSSLFSLLTDKADPITPAEAAALWLKGRTDPNDPDSYRARWAAHYANRLSYERAMLAAEGGTAAAADMEPGGFFRGRQIHAVNKSNVTGAVVSVRVKAERGRLALVNVERAGADAYRAPTPEELAAFLAEKAEAKAAAPKGPSLINPTPADAEKLQGIWNERAQAAARRAKNPGAYSPSTVWEMTQAEYTNRSRGDSGPCATVDVSEKAEPREYRNSSRLTVFKVRMGSRGLYSGYAPRRVVVLTDKPRKPIPWAEVEAARATCPTEADVFPRLGELAELLPRTLWDTDPGRKLLDDAVYLGWAWSSSTSQHGWTDEGCAAYKRFVEQPPAEEPAELWPHQEQAVFAAGALFAID